MFGCVILILLACVYASVEGPRRNMNLRKLLEHPDQYVGQTLTLGTDLKKLQENDAGKIELRDEFNRFDVAFMDPRAMRMLPPKGSVSLKGVVKSDHFYITAYHVHTLRDLKIITSMIALLGAGVYLWRRLPTFFRKNASTDSS